eukprot:4324177-Amphidinium_carterae.1
MTTVPNKNIATDFVLSELNAHTYTILSVVLVPERVGMGFMVQCALLWNGAICHISRTKFQQYSNIQEKRCHMPRKKT